MATIPKPWERQKGETEIAYKAYVQFQDAPSPRKLCDVMADSNALAKSGAWSARWNWQERVREYDNHLANIEQAERDKITARNAQKWAARREVLNEKAHSLSLQLIERATQMLSWPLDLMVSKDGMTHIHPAKWNMATIAPIAKLAVEMGNMAIDSGLSEEDGFDPTTASIEEVREWFEKQKARTLARKQIGSDVG